MPIRVKSQLCLLLVVTAGLLGCNGLTISSFALSLSGVTPVEKLQQQQWQSRRVYLRGKVSDRAPFLDGGAYRLQDATGSVWIMTEQTLPQLGETVLIRGQVESASIPIGSQDLGEVYVIELQQVENDESEADRPSVQSVDELLLPHKSL